MNRRLIVSVVGNAACPQPEDCSVMGKTKWDLAFDLGKTLVDNGCRVVTGGGRGVMRAACAGAHASDKYREGDTIAICPSYDFDTANDFADIVIPTGIDLARDIIIGNSEVVVAIGGGSGTLNEISAAWKLGRLVIAYENVDGWSARLAGKPLDEAIRYDTFKDQIWGVTNAQQVVELIKKLYPLHNKAFDRIGFGSPVLKSKADNGWVGPVKIENPCDVKRLPQKKQNKERNLILCFFYFI